MSADILIISTEGALKRPMTYDDDPFHPIHPVHFLLSNAPKGTKLLKKNYDELR